VRNETGVEIQQTMLDLHVRNVEAAMTYRASVLNAQIDVLRRRAL
jgi:hypothetical protein